MSYELYFHPLALKEWKKLGKAIQEEWNTRRTLAPGISTPEIDRAFLEASKVAPISGKVCGAGGGGCFFVYLPTDAAGDEKAELRSRIQKIFSDQGMRPLNFHGVPHGLEVRVTRD